MAGPMVTPYPFALSKLFFPWEKGSNEKQGKIVARKERSVLRDPEGSIWVKRSFLTLLPVIVNVRIASSWRAG